jgi:phage antirepressor YoqD-like protein/transposase
MNELALGIEKTMTTKEVAAALNVSVDTIQNACKKLQATSENFPKFSQGQRAVYNEAQVTAIKLKLQNHSKVMTVDEVARVLGYDSEYLRKKCTELGFTKNGVKTFLNEEQVTKLKSVLVPRSSDMKVRGQNAVTHLEMLQNIQRDMQWLISYNAELQAENEAQKQQLAIAEPKAQWFDDVADSSNLVEIGTVGKMLGIGQNNFFAILQMNKVIYKKCVDDIEYYLAYSEYEKYFKSVPIPFKKSDGTKLTRNKLMFTQGGAQWAEKRFSTKG